MSYSSHFTVSKTYGLSKNTTCLRFDQKKTTTKQSSDNKLRCLKYHMQSEFSEVILSEFRRQTFPLVIKFLNVHVKTAFLLFSPLSGIIFLSICDSNFETFLYKVTSDAGLLIRMQGRESVEKSLLIRG